MWSRRFLLGLLVWCLLSAPLPVFAADSCSDALARAESAVTLAMQKLATANAALAKADEKLAADERKFAEFETRFEAQATAYSKLSTSFSELSTGFGRLEEQAAKTTSMWLISLAGVGLAAFTAGFFAGR